MAQHRGKNYIDGEIKLAGLYTGSRFFEGLQKII